MASLSRAEAPALARPLCKVREDSFPAATDPVLSLASMEARAVRNPSPAMGLIRRGFFCPRIVYPSRSMEKEASLSTKGYKDSRVEVDENPAPVKGLIHRGCLGSSSVSPSMPVVNKLLSSQVCFPFLTNSHSYGADELGRNLSQAFPCKTEGGAPIYSSISKSQLG